MSALHSAQTPANGIHVVHAFEYANAAARTGATGLVAADVGKVALQIDNKSFWGLQNHSPVTWTQLNGGGATDELAKVSANDTTAGYLNGKLVAGTNITLTELNDGANETLQISAAGGSGEVNLGANVGSGADVFRDKTGVTLNFRGINAASSKISSVVNADNVDIDVVESALSLANIGGALASDAAHGNRGGGALHSAATTSVNGFMSAADKTKLDGLPTSAVPTSRLITAGAGLTGGGDLSADRTLNVAANADGSIVVNADDIQVGVLATDGQHGNRGGGTLHAAATTSVNGFMSAADKTKLDSDSLAGLFHSGVNGEINALTVKSTPVGADILLIEDSAASFAKKKIAISSLPAGSSFDIRNIIAFDHFISGSLTTDRIGLMGWNLATSGVGSSISFIGVAGRPGVVRLTSGTAASGRCALFLGSNSILTGGVTVGGTNGIQFECLVRFPAAADFNSANLEQVVLGLGLEWSSDQEPSNGVYVRFTPASDSFWSLVTANSSTRTVVASSTAPVAGNWVRLGFTATASSVQFFVNGVAAGSPITTNIPTVEVKCGLISRSAGSATAPSIDVDYFSMTQQTDKET